MNLRLMLLLIILISPWYIVSGQKAPKKITISGSVTDANNQPVKGAMIFIDEKNTDYLTDENGNYKVKVKTTAKIISVFTLTSGMAESEIGGKTTIDFQLTGSKSATEIEKEKSMQETVNIGYGSVNKNNTTSSVSKTNDKDSRYAAYNNIYELLTGELAGVQVAGTKITVQGASSFEANTDPLIVVNGVMVSSLDGIRPLEVRSIELLKGSSASIYGSRGSNGVILITLKTAVKQK